MSKFFSAILDILLITIFVGMGVMIYLLYQDGIGMKSQMKRLKGNVDKIVNYDSVISVVEKRMFDSLCVTTNRLEHLKRIQHNENAKLRKDNVILEKRFNDINISDRPEY